MFFVAVCFALVAVDAVAFAAFALVDVVAVDAVAFVAFALVVLVDDDDAFVAND